MSTIIMQEMRKLIKRPLKYRPYPAQHSRMFNQHQQFESSTNCYVFQGLTTWSLTHPLSRFFKFVALIFYPTSWHKNMHVYLPSLLVKYTWWEGVSLFLGLFSHCHIMTTLTIESEKFRMNPFRQGSSTRCPSWEQFRRKNRIHRPPFPPISSAIMKK